MRPLAERVVFLPDEAAPGLVREIPFSVPWTGGFAPDRKRRNVEALHEAAAEKGYPDLLEVSTRSDEELGRRLSAFNLPVHSDAQGDVPLECAYQASKVFEHGGPYTDLLTVDARTAKRDPRLKNSGRITGFLFDTLVFPAQPRTAFYDWLYVSAILPHRDCCIHLGRYRGFTDIEFDPRKSINCQARSCALLVSLMRMNLLDDGIRSPKHFTALMRHHARAGDDEDTRDAPMAGQARS